LFDILIGVANFGCMWGLMVCLSNLIGTYGISNFLCFTQKFTSLLNFLMFQMVKSTPKLLIAILRQSENFGFTAPPSVAIIKAP